MDLDLDPLDRLVAGKREFGEFGGVNASVEISTTFTVLDADTLPAIFSGAPEKGGCYVYGRAFNPTVRHLGRLLAALEGCEAAYPCSSGMAAISSTLMAICNSGDHIVSSNTIYGGSHALLQTFLPAKAAISTTFVDITDLAAVEAALREKPGRVRVLYTEVVSNPTLRVADLRALADLAHGSGALLVVDNTFTPFVVTPRRFGADVVVHSLTKFVSGASDIIAGAICGSAAFIRSLMDFHAGPCMLLGPTMDPRVASELALRLPHLGLRMQEHGRRTSAFASRLAALGAPVTYPGLPDHPQHHLMAAQGNAGYGCGGLLGLDLGSPARANAFMERLQNRHGFGFMAVSLGYFDTLMSLSAASTSSELSDRDMAASGIGRGYVRMSVGITGSLEERWRQLEEAYTFATQLGPDGAAPFRAVRMRRRASGGVDELISWPSMGSFGTAAEGLAEEAGTAAGARAAAAAETKAALDAALAEVLAGGAAGEEEMPTGDGDDADATSGGGGGGGATAAAVTAAASPRQSLVSSYSSFAAAAAASSSPMAAEDAQTVQPPPQAGQRRPLALALPPIDGNANGPALSGNVCSSCGGGEGGGGGGSGGGAVPHVSLSPGSLAGGSGFSPSGRPVKIRRTGSTEIHYVTMPQHSPHGAKA